MNKKIFYQLVICWTCCLEVHGAQYIECLSPDKHNSFVASQSSCSRYIFCDGENSFAGECLDDNYFNEVAGNCDDPAAVKCNVGVTEEVDVGVISLNNTLNNNNTFNAVDKANNSTKIASTSSITSTVATVGVSQTSTNKQPAIGSSLFDIPQCPRSSKAQPHTTVYLPNPRSCSAYFICYYGIAIPMSCPVGYNFNALLGRCERQEAFQCALNRPARMHCVKGVYDLMPHPENCEYYYFCANGFLLIFQCPYQFMWDYERRTCVHRSLAKCYEKSTLHDMLAFDQYPTEFKL